MFKVYLQREGEAGMELILPAAAEEFKVAFTWLQHKEPAIRGRLFSIGYRTRIFSE